MGDCGIDELIDLLLRIVLDLEGLVGEETQPDLADVPHELVFSV